MRNTDFDKGAALEILRYTAKIAAAPAVGGQAGAPAPEPGPLNPTGGATQGGSNNAQMQTGWAAGAMRKSLIKRFTANASRQQKQPVGVAAAKQVGGMGSGMPKVGSALVPMTGMQKLALMEKEAVWPWLARAGMAGWNALRSGGAAARAAVTRSGATRAAPQAADDLGGAASKLIDSRTMQPFTREALTSVPKGSARWAEPVREGVRQKLFGRGSGLSNIYKHKETGQLIKGPRGFFAKGRAPKGYELHKPWTQTGGYLARSGKKLMSYGAKGGLAGYGGSYALNPGKWDSLKSVGETLVDPRRLDMGLGGAALGASFSSIPAAAASMMGPGKKAIDKGYTGASALIKGKGGLMSSGVRGGSYLDIMTGATKGSRTAKQLKQLKQDRKDIKKLDEKSRLGKALKDAKGQQSASAVRRQFKLDEGLKSTRGRRGAGAPAAGSALARTALAKSKRVTDGTKVKAPKAGVIVGNQVV